MKTYISFLRGINVGGKKIIKMETLQELYLQLGLKEVETYIQSGNVFFKSNEKDSTILEQKISKSIEIEYGFEVAVLVKTEEDIAQIIANNPFHAHEISQLYVCLLYSIPEKTNLEIFLKTSFAPDSFSIIQNVVYLQYFDKISLSKLTNNRIESKLKVIATTRNWKTMEALTRKLLS